MHIGRTLLLPKWLWPFLLSTIITTTTISTSCCCWAFTSPLIAGRWSHRPAPTSSPSQPNQPEQQQQPPPTMMTTRLTMANKNPTTFREAEVLGLKLMQEQKYVEALDAFQKGLQLPGSKIDVIRTKSLSGPSPVGGAIGGFDSKSIATLDEFEVQAANYNMACAHAQLGRMEEAVAALRAAFDAGFDNYATVRADPDLAAVQSSEAFRALLDEYEPKANKGFNPFGFFGGGGRK